jgi:uncharacterized Fe-S radical SAM superfamily protein PflX
MGDRVKKSEILGELTAWWAIHEDSIATHDAQICELKDRVTILERMIENCVFCRGRER